MSLHFYLARLLKPTSDALPIHARERESRNANRPRLVWRRNSSKREKNLSGRTTGRRRRCFRHVSGKLISIRDDTTISCNIFVSRDSSRQLDRPTLIPWSYRTRRAVTANRRLGTYARIARAGVVRRRHGTPITIISIGVNETRPRRRVASRTEQNRVEPTGGRTRRRARSPRAHVLSFRRG